MPIYTDDQFDAVQFPSVSGVEGTYRPTAKETMAAVVKNTTTYGAMASSLSNRFMTDDLDDPSYDPMDDIQGYEGYSDEFHGLNRSEVYYKKNEIDEQIKAREVIAAAPLSMSIPLTVAAQALDPVNFIPAFGTAKAASALGVMGKVAAGAGSGAFSGAIQEGVLESFDPTHTAQDAVYGISGSAIIGGMIGGASGAFDLAALRKTGDNIEKSFKTLQSDDAFDQVAAEYQSAGAAASTTFTKEGQQVSSALGAEKLFEFNDPVMRTLMSESLVTQSLSERLARTALLKEKYKTGVASHIPVEEKINAHESVRAKYRVGIDEIYSRYKKAAKDSGQKPMSYGEFGVEVVKAGRRNDASDIPEVAEAAQFVRRNVWNPYLKDSQQLGLIKDDVSVKTAESYVPRAWNRDRIEKENGRWTQVNLDYFKARRDADAKELTELSAMAGDEVSSRLASKFKRTLDTAKSGDDLMKKVGKSKAKEAEELREFIKSTYGEDAEKFLSDYKAGMFTTENIREIDRRIATIENNFQKEASRLRKAEAEGKAEGARAETVINEMRLKADNEIKALQDKFDLLKQRGNVEDDYLYDAVDTLTNRIQGTPYGRLKYDMAADHDMPAYLRKKEKTRGPMKERVYDIPDADVEDFLINDLDHLVENYIRTMSRDNEIMREFGTLEPDEILKTIADDYAKLKVGKSDKEVEKLNKRMRRDMKDVGYMFEKLRGIDSTVSPDYYGSKLGKAERLAMKFNFVRLLGGMTLSALSDIARPIMAKGLTPFIGDGVAAFASDMKNFRKAALELREEAAIGLDMVMNSRIRSIMGVDDYAEPIGKIEQTLDKASQVFGNATLMNQWNTGAKQFTGVLVQSQMIKAIKAIEDGTVTAKQIRDLASSYIDQDMAKRIGAQLKKYGSKEKVVELANMRLWDDKLAKETFAHAIRKEVDNIIITPGLAKPTWLSKPGLRVVGQFRSFAGASMQKAFLSGLQRRDMAMVNGLAISVALGAMSRIIKAEIAGYELDASPQKLILEGIDASGMTGWLMDANNILEKTTAGRIGLNPLIGQAPMSRYASRSALSSVLGPTYGMVGDSLQLSSAAFSGEWKASDSHTLRQLIPFNNIFWLRGILDKAEDNINKSLGVPDTRTGKKKSSK